MDALCNFLFNYLNHFLSLLSYPHPPSLLLSLSIPLTLFNLPNKEEEEEGISTQTYLKI